MLLWYTFFFNIIKVISVLQLLLASYNQFLGSRKKAFNYKFGTTAQILIWFHGDVILIKWQNWSTLRLWITVTDQSDWAASGPGLLWWGKSNPRWSSWSCRHLYNVANSKPAELCVGKKVIAMVSVLQKTRLMLHVVFLPLLTPWIFHTET